MMYTVSSALYRQTAAQLAEAIGSENYYSGSLVFSFDDAECRLTASIIVYRTRIVQPDATTDALSDLVPVWWEFHTVRNGEELLNDFDFAELRRYL